MRLPSHFDADEDAVETVEEIAKPALVTTAEALIPPILGAVPVQSGGMRRLYTLKVEEVEEAGHPQARLLIGSQFWHWLEYGTRWSPAYRPIQTGIERAGVRYVPS